jgi:hypothetical protein
MSSAIAAKIMMDAHGAHSTSKYAVDGDIVGDNDRLTLEEANPEMYEKIIEQVNHVFEKQKTIRQNYFSLFLWLLYFALYASVLVLQRDAVAAFQVEQTLKEVVLTSDSGIIDSGSGEVVPRFASEDDVYKFLKSTVGALYKEEKCGNGICEASESPGYSTKGCAADCGKWANLTTFNITIWDYSTDDNIAADDDSDDDSVASGAKNYWSLCEQETHYCLVSHEALVREETLKKSFELYDGNWYVQVEPSIVGVGGEINKLELDVAATTAFNNTVWMVNATKDLLKYRKNHKKIYKAILAKAWRGCRDTTTMLQNAGYYNVTDCSNTTEGWFCDKEYLGDGVCDSDCNVLQCGFDNGDCCQPEPGVTDMQSFDVWEFQKKGAEVEVFGKQKSRVNKVYVGRDGTNRVISGLLLTQTRKKLEVCSEHSEVSGLTAALFGGSPHARFKDLANRCPSESQVMKDPYGFDAQFLSASKLYNKFVVSEKNDIFPDSTKLSPSGIPYGFHYIDMSAKKGGYPIFFDINIDKTKALDYITFLEDGGYLDEASGTLKMYMLTYNAYAGVFGAMIVTFEFTSTGFINIETNVQSAAVQPYRYDIDVIRLGMEILFVGCVAINALLEFKELFSGFTWDDPLEVFDYFQEVWNYLDVLNIGLLTSSILSWFVYVTTIAPNFKPLMRYELYAPYRLQSNPSIQANWFEAKQDKMKNLISIFDELEGITAWQSAYIGVNGISFIIMIFRTLKMMNFQPRVGLVTRTLEAAAGDLVHFVIVFGIITVGYAVIGHVNFGHAIEEFSTPGASLNTCAEILLGEIGINPKLMEQDFLIPPLLFFWSYIFVAFFILINILLAIIVDSYAIVKENSDDSTPLPKELKDLLFGRLGGILACDGKRRNLERKLSQKLKWLQLVEKAEGEHAENQDESKMKWVRRKVLTVPKDEEAEGTEDNTVELNEEDLIKTIYAGLRGETQTTKQQVNETTKKLTDVVNTMNTNGTSSKVARRKSVQLSKLAKKLQKMGTKTNISEAKAKKQAIKQAKSILKYFGVTRKFRVKRKTKAKKVKKASKKKATEISAVVSIDIKPEDSETEGGDDAKAKSPEKKNSTEFDFPSNGEDKVSRKEEGENGDSKSK